MILVVGNKTYSSWSLRAWVFMEHFQIPFKEILVKFDLPDTNKQIKKYSPSGFVPVLLDEGLAVWDTMAIMEYLNEKFPEKQMWPKDSHTRAKARSVSNEMHSGFQTMREVMSHHMKKKYENYNWSKAKKDVDRIQQIWTECLLEHGGPFLFGKFSIADAMFAPVVNRFITYGIPMEPVIQKYVDTIRNLPAHQKWINSALDENFTGKSHEDHQNNLEAAYLGK